MSVTLFTFIYVDTGPSHTWIIAIDRKPSEDLLKLVEYLYRFQNGLLLYGFSTTAKLVQKLKSDEKSDHIFMVRNPNNTIGYSI